MKKFLKVLGIIVCSICAVVLIFAALNGISNMVFSSYIKSFDKVEYETQLEPSLDNGHYTFITDGDFKVMQINDIHLGGGHYMLKKDKKTIYEVMTMVQKEKPDLVILNGDNIFAVPGPIFNGGGTLNNRMASKRIIQMFEQLGVYYTTSFGNHDTEAFDYYNRKQIGKLFQKDKNKYCIFQCEFDGYGVSNQCILVKNTNGNIRKALILIDSNDYVDDSLSSTINWLYDTIHDEQVEWAKNLLTDLGNPKSFVFCHIPIGEFETAYRDLKANDFNDKVDEKMGGRIWYGGCQYKDKAPEDNDILFEELGPDGINSLQGIFCGHDHVNNATVEYRGVVLAYGMSIDNIAYSNIAKYGLQRGAMVITIENNGDYTITHKNAYLDYGVDSHKFYDVDLEHHLYEDYAPTNR